MQEGLVSSHAIRQMYQIQDNNVLFKLSSKKKKKCYLSLEQYLSFDNLFWPVSFKTKCFSCKKGLCHIIQSYKCMKCKIVRCDLAFNYSLGFGRLF